MKYRFDEEIVGRKFSAQLSDLLADARMIEGQTMGWASEETMVFSVVNVPNERKIDLSYSGRNQEWIYSVGFKGARKCRSDVKWAVIVNGETAGVVQVEMTEDEEFVRIPFRCVPFDDIALQVTNMTDVTDIIITHKSISF